MQNFPQSFEPVSSDSILEEFLQLKRNVNEVNDGMVQVQTDLANEVNDRELADQNLQTQIDEIAGRQGTSVKVAGVVQEEVSFTSDPQTQINSKQNSIADLESIRNGASLGATAVQPSQLTSVINDESSARQLADQNLQSQIDDIVGSSGTTVKVAGVAQTEVSFTSDPQSQINGKQGTISDLATIRSGASLGATAVQPGTLASELATKQDTISDLATIRSGASLGATAVQPGTLTSELANKLGRPDYTQVTQLNIASITGANALVYTATRDCICYIRGSSNKADAYYVQPASATSGGTAYQFKWETGSCMFILKNGDKIIHEGTTDLTINWCDLYVVPFV